MGALEKKRLLRALTAAALFAGAALFAAQSPVSGVRLRPGEEDLRRAEKLLEKLAPPDMESAEKALSAARKNAPEKTGAEDAAELLSAAPPQKNLPAHGAAAGGSPEPFLFYFFSFSVPESSLRAAARETAAAGGVMVLRGLSGGSLAETARRVSRLIGKTGAEAWIDPFLFECLSVEAVPQTALVYGWSPQAPCAELRRAKVSGDVPLAYALEILEKEDENASPFAERLAQSGHGRD